jgi:excinuclease ABC subunit C
MEQASQALAFEDAAVLRDRIRALTTVQSQQEINLQGLGDVDVIAGHQAGGLSCVEVFFFRGGCNYGNHSYFPAHGAGEPLEAVIEAFLAQFYSDRPPPPRLILGQPLPSAALIEDALSVRAGRRVRLTAPRRGSKRRLYEHALANARDAMARRLAEGASQQRLLAALAERLDLDGPPARIEVYDNSHTLGTDAIGAMVVAGPEGPIRNAYRKFTIRGQAIAAGDDYAMLREVLTRRFARAIEDDPDRTAGTWPDLVLIDGGLGQLTAARAVLAELGIDDLALAAIAKGPERNAGRERIFLPDRPPLSLEPRDPVLYFLQRLRDEAHRFAIGTHRAKRGSRLGRSQLDEIPGIGAKRKKALLHHFGSLQAIARAGCADLEAVPGINRAMAKKIHDWFRPPE